MAMAPAVVVVASAPPLGSHAFLALFFPDLLDIFCFFLKLPFAFLFCQFRRNLHN